MPRIRTVSFHILAPTFNTNLLLTNISKSVITFTLEDGIAYIIFNLLDTEPGEAYNGVFQNEEGEFFAISAYSEQYRKQMNEVENFAF